MYFALSQISAKGGETMQITDVRVRKVNDEGKMQAIASVTFDDEFVVHDIKIISGQNGLFIAMPSRKMIRIIRLYSAAENRVATSLMEKRLFPSELV